MTDGKMPQDVLEALADFAELDRLRGERRRAGQAVAGTLGWSDGQLALAFEQIELHVEEGLTVTASACLAGVTRRTLAAWVKLADDRRSPWGAWLDGLMRQDAQRRRAVLRALHKIAGNDSRALRDLANQRGRPSPLEYEVEGLRRSKTSAVDVMVMPSDADRNRAPDATNGGPCVDPQKAGVP